MSPKEHKRARILLIEDELPMRTALAETLKAQEYHVKTAQDGPEGLELACREPADLILLDVMMPGLDGFSLCRELRRREVHTPVLMLTAKSQVEDRVTGLDAGADDYLVKPFSRRELLARVQAQLRRHRFNAKERMIEKVSLGSCCFDFQSCTLVRDGEEISINTKELAIMRLLSQRRGQAISREDFLDVIWDYGTYPTTRTVDNYIASLRSKIELDSSSPRYILTVRGVGYRLAEEGS